MLNTSVADHCYTLPTTQMTLALNFLRENQDRVGLVTIDLGFNDIRPCLTTLVVNENCVTKSLAYVQNDLPAVLEQLKSAAGAQVHFVGFNYEDPFVAHYLEGPHSISNAQETLTDMMRLDQILESIYAKAKIPVANIAGEFQTLNASPVVIPNVGTVPVNVAYACYYTWMCQPKPFGPDDHPDNAGYMLIAEAIAKVLPGAWRIPVVK
jgi:lysophospholipase L1-like esterase